MSTTRGFFKTLFVAFCAVAGLGQEMRGQCSTISVGIGSTGHYTQSLDVYQTYTMPANGLVTGFTFYGAVSGGQTGNITYRVYRMPQDTLVATAVIFETGAGDSYYGTNFGYQPGLYFTAGSTLKVRVSAGSLSLLQRVYYSNNNPYSGGSYSQASVWDMASRLYTSVAPEVSLSKSSIAFGSLSLGSQGVDSVVVTNPGCYTLTISSVTKSSSSITVSPTSAVLAAGASQTFSVNYLPTNTGTTTDTLRFISDSPVEDTVRVPVSATAAATAPSSADRAILEDGSTSYTQVASPPSIANSSFTLECWAKSASATPSGWFFGQGIGANDQGLHIGYISSTAVRFGFWSDDVDYTSVTDANNWHHWAFTYDATTNLQTIYRDGVSVATHTTTNDYSGTGTFYIGRLFSGGSFSGTIDEVRMWNVARTAQQVQNYRYQTLTGTESGLIGYWRFDESSGTTCVDASGHGRTATLVNSQTRVTSTASLAPMSAATNAATGIGHYGATCNGTVNAIGLSTTVRFFYGLTTSYTDSIEATGSPVSGTSAQSVSATLSSVLSPKTTYHVAVRAQNAYGTLWGSDQTFTTNDIEPDVQASDINILAIGPDSVLFSWTAGDGYGDLVFVKEGSADDGTPVDLVTYAGSETYGAGDQVGSGNFVVQASAWRAATIRGLSPSTTYHVAVFEYNGSAGIEDYLQTNPVRASFTTASETLPVQMMAFTAAPAARTVELRWRTATETNNAGWEVERRAIGDWRLTNVDYQTIGFVEGAGASSSPLQYTFTDYVIFDNRNSTIENATRFAYRLKQLDRSGSFTYSHEAEVEVGTAPKEFTLGQNYPNPFNPSTTIEFTVPEDGRTTLKIFDMLGREVGTLLDEDVKAGYYHHSIFDASGLPSGIYFARLQSGGHEMLRKMLLMK